MFVHTSRYSSAVSRAEISVPPHHIAVMASCHRNRCLIVDNVKGLFECPMRVFRLLVSRIMLILYGPITYPTGRIADPMPNPNNPPTRCHRHPQANPPRALPQASTLSISAPPSFLDSVGSSPFQINDHSDEKTTRLAFKKEQTRILTDSRL